MGIQDQDRLQPVYRACVDFCFIAQIPFKFKVDRGCWETAIEFFYDIDEKIYHTHPPKSPGWSTDPKILCPDILDYDNKIIIEIEEEPGPRLKGAKMARKGHSREGDLDTKKDTERNRHYKDFRVFRLWESTLKNENWQIKLFLFLINCYQKN